MLRRAATLRRHNATWHMHIVLMRMRCDWRRRPLARRSLLSLVSQQALRFPLNVVLVILLVMEMVLRNGCLVPSAHRQCLSFCAMARSRRMRARLGCSPSLERMGAGIKL